MDAKRERRPAFDLWRVAACCGIERPRMHAIVATIHQCTCCSTMHLSKKQVSLERFGFGKRDEVKNPEEAVVPEEPGIDVYKNYDSDKYRCCFEPLH